MVFSIIDLPQRVESIGIHWTLNKVPFIGRLIIFSNEKMEFLFKARKRKGLFKRYLYVWEGLLANERMILSSYQSR